jgi:hypothetical protein
MFRKAVMCITLTDLSLKVKIRDQCITAGGSMTSQRSKLRLLIPATILSPSTLTILY